MYFFSLFFHLYIHLKKNYTNILNTLTNILSISHTLNIHVLITLTTIQVQKTSIVRISLKAKCSHQYLTRQDASTEIKTNLGRVLFSGICSYVRNDAQSPFVTSKIWCVYLSARRVDIHKKNKSETCLTPSNICAK